MCSLCSNDLIFAYAYRVETPSMLYHTTTILLFRPFMSQDRSKLLPESSDPLGLCTCSAVKVVSLARAFRTRYGLRNIVNIAVHAVFTASTIHLCNVASTNTSYESSARQYLSSCISFLREIGETWPCALRCLHVIHSLMAKFKVTMTSSATTQQPQGLPEDGGLPNNDYTYKERARQRTINSLPTMPQIPPQHLPRPTFLGTHQQHHHHLHTPMSGVETTFFEPSQQGFPAAAGAMPQQSQQQQQEYIPTDFDMSFFDVTDISLSMHNTYSEFPHNTFSQ